MVSVVKPNAAAAVSLAFRAEPVSTTVGVGGLLVGEIGAEDGGGHGRKGRGDAEDGTELHDDCVGA